MFLLLPICESLGEDEFSVRDFIKESEDLGVVRVFQIPKTDFLDPSGGGFTGRTPCQAAVHLELPRETRAAIQGLCCYLTSRTEGPHNKGMEQVKQDR